MNQGLYTIENHEVKTNKSTENTNVNCLCYNGIPYTPCLGV